VQLAIALPWKTPILQRNCHESLWWKSYAVRVAENFRHTNMITGPGSAMKDGAGRAFMARPAAIMVGWRRDFYAPRLHLSKR
jgi:hypothetical protein